MPASSTAAPSAHLAGAAQGGCGAPRLYVDADLFAGARLLCRGEQANYLRNVLRLDAGDAVRVFNGRDGEWEARLAARGKRETLLDAVRQTRAQEREPDIDYLFAPLKRARLDYVVQKAVELGVARLRPVLTRRTVVGRVNLERMRANAVEAAEQCGRLRVPAVEEPQPLASALAALGPARPLVFCDETSTARDPLAALNRLRPGPIAVLIGPEGGFDAQERQLLLGHAFVTPLSLGPRLLRADTAGVAALALVNAALGDWR
jgi:16S rRNA (uracil1498-N3)-methyltransferase